MEREYEPLPIFVIRNIYTGGYIHKSLFRIMTFSTRSEAKRYIRDRGLNEDIFEVVAVWWQKKNAINTAVKHTLC